MVQSEPTCWHDLGFGIGSSHPHIGLNICVFFYVANANGHVWGGCIVLGPWGELCNKIKKKRAFVWASYAFSVLPMCTVCTAPAILFLSLVHGDNSHNMWGKHLFSSSSLSNLLMSVFGYFHHCFWLKMLLFFPSNNKIKRCFAPHFSVM